MKNINIIIYESSSFGGCYDYSRQLISAYAKQDGVESVELLLPKNASATGKGVKRFLLWDELSTTIIIVKKLWFILRVFVNPLLLFFYLLFKKQRHVLLNDFEQLSAWYWSPLYRFLLPWHSFSVFLHDPDRDAYPPSPKVSSFLIKVMMHTMDLAFYHEILPDKPYYKGKRTRYIAVPHGIYPAPPPDVHLLETLNNEIVDRYCFAIIGNIREEKNVDLAIRALANVPNGHLVIAGKTANSSVDIARYHQLSKELNVENRITWITRFLSEAELSSVISRCDAVLLYYRSSFTSQSAIVNLIAPFKKKLIVSDTSSALATTVRKFGNGILVPPDEVVALTKVMEKLPEQNNSFSEAWQDYIQYASWENNAFITVNAMQEAD